MVLMHTLFGYIRARLPSIFMYHHHPHHPIYALKDTGERSRTIYMLKDTFQARS